jgi:putative hydrolase of the HAD superfamily
VAMAVVSDWGHGLEAILLELELGKYFQHLAVSSRLGLAKPDPAVFHTALSRLEADAAGSVFVGDTYVKDVLGARAAGIEPVLLDRPGLEPPVDCAIVNSLADLLPLLGLDDPRQTAMARH